jgi:integrase/recombinase XerD
MNATVSIVLDSRRKKTSGVYPVKLRVYSPIHQIKKLYSTGIDLTEKEFESVWLTQKVKKEYEPARTRLKLLETKAIRDVESTKPFTFESFERNATQKVGDKQNIFYYYQQTIEELERNERISTASNYQCSKNSIQGFLAHKGNNTENLPLLQITPEWLQEYENYMLRVLERSPSTVGIYLRPLRAIYNSAIAQNAVPQEYYPFGRRKYIIPTARRVKKDLTGKQLKKLYYAKAATNEQEKARDFFFLSYMCNGLNMKDIALLRYKNIRGEELSFFRAKTIHTAKKDLKPIQVYLTKEAQAIIKKYGNKPAYPDSLVFSIINDQQTAKEKHRSVQNFTRFVNEHIKTLAKTVGLPEDISTYFARWSFATNSINKGASMEEMMEALGHSDMKTTKNYYGGFDERRRKELSKKLMNF